MLYFAFQVMLWTASWLKAATSIAHWLVNCARSIWESFIRPINLQNGPAKIVDEQLIVGAFCAIPKVGSANITEDVIPKLKRVVATTEYKFIPNRFLLKFHCFRWVRCR